MLLRIENIEFAYESVKVLDGITFNVNSGEFIGVMGPNGSGKTTLLRCINNILTPQVGTVLIDGKMVNELSRRAIAKRIGVVPQSSNIEFAYTIHELVLMGRTAHIDRFHSETKRDFELVNIAMKLTNISHLAERTFEELSGGEQQRVIIARALAQEPRVLLLDEPTLHLDISCQFEIMDLVKKLATEKNIIVIAVFHDLNLASQYSDRLLLLDKGKIVSIGTPQTVLTPENIRKTYNINAIVRTHPLTGTPYVTPYHIVSKRAKSAKDRRLKVHIICGGGSGAVLMKLLLQRGYELSAGVLSTIDTDYELTRELGVSVVGELPFSEISQHAHHENIELIRAADAVMVTDFPVGMGNIKNLDAIISALEANKPVIIIHTSRIQSKDFTSDGKLKTYFDKFKANGAVFVKNCEQGLQQIDNLLAKNPPEGISS
jgi:iron complex transport system ATP-binding protein